MLVELNTKDFTIDLVNGKLIAELSDFGRDHLPQVINIRSHVTGKVYQFSTDANNEIWKRVGTPDQELVGWKYWSSVLPGWQAIIFND